MSEEGEVTSERSERAIYEIEDRSRRVSRISQRHRHSKANPCLRFLQAVWAKFTETKDKSDDLDSLELYYLIP
ncbi:hypothetical protein HUJ04_006566 [Dendroctonus ponderosae]|nr:hypothetical protein HUJ04_006566 [Dendroctonus ponderosae]